MDLPGLNFTPGKVIQAEIQRRFASPVSFSPSSCHREFFLVISFGRCKFRLLESSVSLILQAVLGGTADHFCVLHLGDRVFRFSVSSQDVGFHIYKLRSFECSAFKVYFNLWYNGGANFRQEFQSWEKEQLA